MANSTPIYAAHFGLKKAAFGMLPDPGFLYWSEVHGQAYAMLEYAVLTAAPITVITGEIGAGKTTLVRELLTKLPGGFEVGLISNAHEERGELLHWVMKSFGLEIGSDDSYVEKFGRFQEFLIKNYASGSRGLVIVDEAQNLSELALEELRLYSNINTETDLLLQLILVGQPELRDKIAAPGLVQFQQRVTAAFHLRPMTQQAVAKYIAHRLNVAGASREIFSTAACERVWRHSGGIPRLINKICEHALVYAYGDGSTVIDGDVVERIVDDWKMQGFDQVHVKQAETLVQNAPQLASDIVALHLEGSSADAIEKLIKDERNQKVSADCVRHVIHMAEKSARTRLSSGLQRDYPLVFFESVDIKVADGAAERRKPVCVALAIGFDGVADVAGIWIGGATSRKAAKRITRDLRERGVGEILIAEASRNSILAGELAAAFPGIVVAPDAPRLVRQALGQAAWQHRKAIRTSLHSILLSATPEQAQQAFEIFRRDWGELYPAVRAEWNLSWAEVQDFLRLDMTLRHALLAVNEVDAVRKELVRLAARRQAFLNDDQALLCLIGVLDRYAGRVAMSDKAIADIAELATLTGSAAECGASAVETMKEPS